MRKGIGVVSLVVTVVMLVVPSYSYGWSHGPYYGHYGHSGYGYSGWDVAGALAGGLLLGTILGVAITQNAVREPVYQRPSRVMEPVPYACPDPAFISKYGQRAEGLANTGEASRGEWVLVPGQQVQGQWVPPHKVWIPANP